MATYTPNYSLIEPDYAEEADVEKLNDNMESIDSLIYQGRRIAVGGYDSTATYNTGDLVEYSNALYRCKDDGVTGTWDSTKWELTTLADEIESKGEGGADVTKEVSGNPVEFDDGASAPLVKCDVTITGSQDLHGYDKPWVGGAGKNKLPVIGPSTTISGVVYTVDDFGVVTANNTATQSSTYTKTFTLKAGTYILNGCPSGGSSSGTRTYAQDVYSTNYQTHYAEDLGNGSTFTLESDTEVLFRIVIFEGYTANNLKFYPMIRLATESDPTFTPYSNICPITAYTEGEIEVRGKNLFGTSVSSGYTITSLGVIESDPTRSATLEYTSIQGNIDYVLSYVGNMNNGVFFYDENKDFISFLAWGSTPRTFKSPLNAAYLRFSFNSATVPVNMMVEKGSVATTYEPYTSTTHTTTYPSAIYRGSEDVVNGTVGADSNGEEWIYLEFDGSSDEQWNVVDGARRAVIPLPKVPYYLSSSTKSDLICNRAETITANGTYSGNIGCATDSTRFTYSDGTRSMVLADFKTWLSNNPLQIAYRVATPTTSSVTPTNAPVKSLNGYNHIESSTGDLDIEYITEDFQPIVDLIEANASEPYSDDYTLDTEIEVGTWVDGSTLYRKTKEITGIKNAGYEGTIYTAGSGEHIVKLDGCIYNDYYSGMAYPINMAYSSNNGTMAFSTYVTGSDAETVLFKNGWNSTVSKIYLVVYYIKSSS